MGLGRVDTENEKGWSWSPCNPKCTEDQEKDTSTSSDEIFDSWRHGEFDTEDRVYCGEDHDEKDEIGD